MKKNILVFPCGSEVGLEINRALANSSHFELYGASSTDDHGKYVYKNYIDGLPFVDANSFTSELNKVIKLHKIDYIVPAHDSAVLKMSINQDKILVPVITSCANTCRICRSKSKTYHTFEKLLPTPEIYDISKNMRFPVFLKPDVGQGSKGTFIAKSIKEVKFYSNIDPSLLCLEYLPGKEYTVDCFTDRERNLLFAGGRERVRISNGISVNSKPINNPKFQELALIINQNLIFQGAWFYQVKERANGELVLMEIAPRVSGTMALYRVLGINFVQMSIYDKMGIDVNIIKNNLHIEIDRALFARFKVNHNYSCVYVDLDDTIIINNMVNTDLIKFLYQTKNMGKEIVLITRHKKNINKTLANFAISSSLFDRIITVKESQKKSDFINNKKSILIDDSFSERKQVFDAAKIPVYGLDAIEALLNWKN